MLPESNNGNLGLQPVFTAPLATLSTSYSASPLHSELTLFQIFSTVWPSLAVHSRIALILGSLATLLQSLSTPIFAYILSSVFSDVLGHEPQNTVFNITLPVLTIAAADALTLFLQTYLLESCAQSWIYSLRITAVYRILHQPLIWFNAIGNAKISGILEDLEKHAENSKALLSRFAGYSIVGGLMSLIALVWSAFLCARMTLVGMVMAGIAVGISQRTAVASDAWEESCREASDEVTRILAEMVVKVDTVRSFGLEQWFRRKLTLAMEVVEREEWRRAVNEGFWYGLVDAGVMLSSGGWYLYTQVCWFAVADYSN